MARTRRARSSRKTESAGNNSDADKVKDCGGKKEPRHLQFTPPGAPCAELDRLQRLKDTSARDTVKQRPL
jgi:hypothetical protein